jgi:hypothetical protein
MALCLHGHLCSPVHWMIPPAPRLNLGVLMTLWALPSLILYHPAKMELPWMQPNLQIQMLIMIHLRILLTTPLHSLLEM